MRQGNIVKPGEQRMLGCGRDSSKRATILESALVVSTASGILWAGLWWVLVIIPTSWWCNRANAFVGCSLEVGAGAGWIVGTTWSSMLRPFVRSSRNTVSREDSLSSLGVVDSSAPSIVKLLQDCTRVTCNHLNLIREVRDIGRDNGRGSNGFARGHGDALLGGGWRVLQLCIWVVVVKLSRLLQQCRCQVLLFAVAAERQSSERKDEEASYSSQANQNRLRNPSWNIVFA